MNPRRLIVLTLGLALSSAAALPEDATELRLPGWPALSPDGEKIAFAWLDDLWLAPSAGGEARRATRGPARDLLPLFSPDGKRLVFTREQNGGSHVYSIALAGEAEPLRHTHHSEGNALECLSADGTRAIIRGSREHAGLREMRLMEVDLAGQRREQRLFDAAGHSAAWSPDGRRVMFCRGGEQLFRKGYQGSRTSQLWLFDRSDGSFEQLQPNPGDLRSPRWHPDGGGYFHVADADGTPNLYSTRFGSPAPEQLTFFRDDGVILRDVSADATTLLLRRSWQVLRYRPALDPEPQVVEFWTREKVPDAAIKVERVTGTNHADFTPALDRVVFAAAGDLWSGTANGKKPRQLTKTAAAESDVRFSPDGNWLYFLRDDGLQANYFRARWTAGALADEQAVTHGQPTKSRLQPSPDGRRVAWIEGNGTVFAALADGSEAVKLFECWDPPTLDWAPDGSWLALAAKDQHSNRDIWLAKADGSRAPVNLTRDPAFEGAPKWSPDGRHLVFTARRNPARTAELWCVDLGEAGISSDPDDAALTQAGEQARKIGTAGIEPIRVIWTEDSSAVLFQSADQSDPRLQRVELRGGRITTVIQQRGVPIRMTPAGALLWRTDRTPAVLMDGKLTEFPFTMRVRRDRGELLRLGFRRIWRTLGERFYDPEMNGTNWPALLEKYEAQAVAARNSRQFDRLVGQLLGELNASHLTFQTRPWPNSAPEDSTEPATAHTGLVFEEPTGSGPLKIRGVIPGSPTALLAEPPLPGDAVLSIDGVVVGDDSPLHPFLNGAVGKTLKLRLRARDGTARDAEITCISYPQLRRLKQLATVAAAQSASGGDIAYLALEKMKWADFEALEREIYRASLDKSGLVLDLRGNGGGQVADHLLALFCQPIHAFTIPRDGLRGYPHERRTRVAWDHSLVVLCDQNTYSNAEIFCHAIQQTGRAPLVGTATAGGVISAVKVTIPDTGVLQIPFRGWFHAGTGMDLDLNGAVPEHPVPLTPADEAAGRDPQLAAALEILRAQIRGLPQPVEPRRRHGR